MKQFDTVENNEWIPTEEDLEGAIKVVDTLPTASASELGITYLLNGTMEGYTKTHFYKCIMQTVDGITTYVWDDLNVGRYSVGNCTNIRLMMFDDGDTYRVIMSWKDPEDVIVGSEHIYWKETRLVHQVGHVPIDVNDGIETFTNTYRDQYSSFGSFSFSFAADGRKHYFKLFPVSEDGAITNDDANSRAAGYNYVQTGDSDPQYDYSTGAAMKTYYKKEWNASTGLYEFTPLEWSSTNFDGGGSTESPWTFKTTIVYYEYSNSFITWAGICELIRNGEAETFFPIGTILTLPYHGDFGEMAFEVVDYDTVDPADPSVKRTMTLESKYLNRWWDYNGGVVFDTNERAGALTADTSISRKKLYFIRLVQNSDDPIKGEVKGTDDDKRYYDRTADNTVAASNKSVSGCNELFVESVYDSHDCYARFGDGRFDNSGNMLLGISTSYLPSGATGASVGDLFECELPYVTIRDIGLSTGMAVSATDATNANKASSAANVTAMANLAIAANKGLIVKWTGATNFQSNIGTTTQFLVQNHYYMLQDHGGSLRWMDFGSTDVRGKSVYGGIPFAPSAPKKTVNVTTSNGLVEHIDDCGVKYADGQTTTPLTTQVGFSYGEFAMTSKTSAALTTDLRTQQVACQAAGWGPLTWPRQVLGSPRTNRYADRWMALPVVGTPGQTNKIGYSASIKYYIPVEQYVTRYRAAAKANTIVSYDTGRRIYLRDASDDIYRVANELNTKLSGISANAVTAYKSTNGSSNLLACTNIAYLNNDKYEFGFEDLLKRLIRFPTHDDVFMQGKDYWKLLILPGVNSVLGSTDPATVWYYKKNGTLPNGSDRWERASRADAVSAGADGGVGVFIPVHVGSTTEMTSKSWVVDGSDSTLYWKSVTAAAAARLPYNVPFFASKDLSGTFVADAPDETEGTYYTPCYLRTAQSIIPNTGKLPYAKYVDSAVKFTDDGVNYYGSSNTDFRGVSPVQMDGRNLGTTDEPEYPGYCGYSTIQPTNAAADFKGGQVYGIRTVEYYEGAISGFLAGAGVIGWDGSVIPLRGSTTAEAEIQPQVNVYLKTANTERVAYGNHVWAQSNLRYYYNGPFDKSLEYIETKDGVFHEGQTYYRGNGSTFERLIPATSSSATTYKSGDSIVAWQGAYGFTIYTKYAGGIPVGYRLDINRPDKHHEYGLSPVMQYVYDTVLLNWVPAYKSGSCWWSENHFEDSRAHRSGEFIGVPSINNGLVYDRLATMFWSNCILKGLAGGCTDEYIRLSPVSASTTSTSEGGYTYGGWSSDSMQVKIGGQFQTMAGIDITTGSVRTANFKQIYPRQSFLHGFLDCKYKRSSDFTFQADKDYYLKTPYGTYEKLDTNHSFVTGGPYAHGLYEENPNYYNDLKDAKEFLEAIVPVINRNGCYGTEAAYDFYPQKGSVAPNLGGTVTIDKVWLMSTSQVNGGSTDNNGIYENPEGGAAKSSKVLDKWLSYGASSNNQVLNTARIKKGLTLGAHATVGYADIMASAQYWWLRSAGGVWTEVSISPASLHDNYLITVQDHAIKVTGWTNYGTIRSINSDLLRLSPLITLG